MSEKESIAEPHKTALIRENTNKTLLNHIPFYSLQEIQLHHNLMRLPTIVYAVHY